MKKIIALLLTVVMVMSLATVASASVDTSEWKSEAKAQAISLNKVYTVTGATDKALFPAETLTFTSTPDASNPDTTNITIDPLAVAGNANQEIVINLPSYSKVGVYKYTIAETAGNTQGVTYTDAKLYLTVLVEYDYDNENLKATIGITKIQEEKNDTFTNEYDVGSLSVTKVVTGNLGDKEKKFAIDVTFTASNPVLSAITYTGGKSISVDDMKDGTHTVTIELADAESVQFDNIPAGVAYVVAEQDYTTGEKNGENAYDAPVYENEKGTIAKDTTAAAKVTNNKATTVDTGITMDVVPFVVMIVVAALGLVAFTAKKRVQE